MDNAPDPGVAALDRIRAATPLKANQSPLFQWCVRHFDAIAQILDGQTRPGWDAVTAELNRDGLKKANGSDLTPEYVRQTWWKVRHARARVEARQTGAVAAVLGPQSQAPEMVPGPAYTPLPEEAAAGPPETNEFGLAFAGGLKDWTKT